MLIKMTLNEVSKTLERLNALGNLHLPTSLGFAIAKNQKMLIEELQIAEAQRQEKLKQCAKIDENGNIVEDTETGNAEFKDDKAEKEFLKFYTELYGTETEFNINAVEMNVLDLCEKESYDNLTVDNINTLLFMLEE